MQLCTRDEATACKETLAAGLREKEGMDDEKLERWFTVKVGLAYECAGLKSYLECAIIIKCMEAEGGWVILQNMLEKGTKSQLQSLGGHGLSCFRVGCR